MAEVLLLHHAQGRTAGVLAFADDLRAAVLLHSAIPPADLGGSWPAGVPAQVHVMQDDAWGDVDEARALAAEAPDVEVFLYPGSDHLFTDRSLTAYDEAAAALVRERVLALLEQVDARRADSTPPRP